MTIKAEIVLSSRNSAGKELNTYSVLYPRFIHSELMTHRVFSRNASSSRAIPVARQIKMVVDDPAIPIHFTRNKAGMQGGEALQGDEHERATRIWLAGRDMAVETAKWLEASAVHKQYANRVIEPYSHIAVVITATEWSNFFALRYHSMAQPEIAMLAIAMWEAYQNREVQDLEDGEWHTPYVNRLDLEQRTVYHSKYAMTKEGSARSNAVRDVLKMSSARCGRVSYLNHEGKTPTVEEDLGLYSRLVEGFPKHASPTEHQAMACGDPNVQSGNFFGGWIQHRKTIKDENIAEFDGPLEPDFNGYE